LWVCVCVCVCVCWFCGVCVCENGGVCGGVFACVMCVVGVVRVIAWFGGVCVCGCVSGSVGAGTGVH